MTAHDKTQVEVGAAVFVCNVCTYPAYKPCASECDNPACEGNPSIPDSVKKQWAEDRALRNAEESERERIRAIRRRMMKGTR